jgi:hypothetical protein
MKFALNSLSSGGKNKVSEYWNFVILSSSTVLEHRSVGKIVCLSLRTEHVLNAVKDLRSAAISKLDVRSLRHAILRIALLAMTLLQVS